MIRTYLSPAQELDPVFFLHVRTVFILCDESTYQRDLYLSVWSPLVVWHAVCALEATAHIIIGYHSHRISDLV